MDAYHSGNREKILYVVCINPEPKKRLTPDYLAVIDVDPSSPTYSQVSYDLDYTYNVTSRYYSSGAYNVRLFSYKYLFFKHETQNIVVFC